MTVAPKKDRLSPPLMLAFRSAHAARDARKKLDLRDESGERVIAGRRAAGRMPITEAAAAPRGRQRSRSADEHGCAGIDRDLTRSRTRANLDPEFWLPGHCAPLDRRDLGRRPQGRDRVSPDALTNRGSTARRSGRRRDKADRRRSELQAALCRPRRPVLRCRSTFPSNSSPTSISTAATSRSTGFSR